MSCAAWWVRAFGWREAPYLPCPEDLYELAENLVEVRAGVRIVPGMRCSNPLGAPDVMRGEETQLLGARELEPRLEHGRQLVCMPGTHTKWVSLHDGVVHEFLTAPTGELFAMLCDHSVLVRDRNTPVSITPPISARPRRGGEHIRKCRCCTGCSRAAACGSTSSCPPKARRRGPRAC